MELLVNHGEVLHKLFRRLRMVLRKGRDKFLASILKFWTRVHPFIDWFIRTVPTSNRHLNVEQLFPQSCSTNWIAERAASLPILPPTQERQRERLVWVKYWTRLRGMNWLWKHCLIGYLTKALPDVHICNEINLPWLWWSCHSSLAQLRWCRRSCPAQLVLYDWALFSTYCIAEAAPTSQ
jgi:hypothetical protein